MKTGHLQNDSENSPAIPVDPFAGDFFGGLGAATDEHEEATDRPAFRRSRQKSPKSDWFKTLPRVSNREAALSNAIAALPVRLTDDLLDNLSATIGRFTFSDAVECELISVSEVELNAAVNAAGARPRVYLNIGDRRVSGLATIVLDVEFASSLVDSVLDGPSVPTAVSNGLSPIETVIIEFMAANLLGAINELAGDDMLVLENVSHDRTPVFNENERGAELVLKIAFGERHGIVTAFLSGTVLRNLRGSARPLVHDSRSSRSLAKASRVCSEFDARLVAGTTTLDSLSLGYLEPSDVVIIEQPLIGLDGGGIGAGPHVLIGAGVNFRLRGRADDNGFNGNLLFTIDEILSEESRRVFTAAKFKMDEKDLETADSGVDKVADEADELLADESDEQISPALENIQVALRVEIAGNKISLRDLQDLRAGQIIALGCSPNDPVRLVTDNNDEPVATGELIEIEGQLGVRLTRVFI